MRDGYLNPSPNACSLCARMPEWAPNEKDMGLRAKVEGYEERRPQAHLFKYNTPKYVVINKR